MHSDASCPWQVPVLWPWALWLLQKQFCLSSQPAAGQTQIDEALTTGRASFLKLECRPVGLGLLVLFKVSLQGKFRPSMSLGRSSSSCRKGLQAATGSSLPHSLSHPSLIVMTCGLGAVGGPAEEDNRKW